MNLVKHIVVTSPLLTDRFRANYTLLLCEAIKQPKSILGFFRILKYLNFSLLFSIMYYFWCVKVCACVCVCVDVFIVRCDCLTAANVRRNSRKFASSYNYYRIGYEYACLVYTHKTQPLQCWQFIVWITWVLAFLASQNKAFNTNGIATVHPRAIANWMICFVHTKTREHSSNLSSVYRPRYLLPKQFSTIAIIFKRKFLVSIFLLLTLRLFHFLLHSVSHNVVIGENEMNAFLVHKNGFLFTGEWINEIFVRNGEQRALNRKCRNGFAFCLPMIMRL